MTRMTALLTAFALAAPAGAQSDFLAPDNWQGLGDYWKVEGDTVTGSTGPGGLKFNTFLCSKRQYGDFELTFRVKLDGGRGNSGVQVRSEVFDREKFAVKGPQCDIGAGFWGSLYGEQFGGMMQEAPAGKVNAKLKPDDFNDYRIRCAGKKFTIEVNGVTSVDAEFPKAPEKGVVAFQLHAGPEMTVTFADVKFKELSGGE